MKPVRKWIRNLIEEFNEKWKYELNISKIVFWNQDGAEYQGLHDGSGVIKLNPNQQRIDIKEDLYHELGHAILDQYKVPSYLLNSFRDSSPLMSRHKSEKLTFEDELPPPNGHVSWYSLVNGTEDFCEILSAWACSGYKMKGKIDYGPWSHSIDNEQKLKKKIQKVHHILSFD